MGRVVMETERAWAAGFFDGEGYVGYHENARSNSRQMSATISQSSFDDAIPEVLIRFMNIVEVGGIYGPTYLINSRPRYRWNAWTVDDIETVFEIMKPYLGVIKRTQFDDAIRKYRNKLTYKELGLCRNKLHVSEEGRCKECIEARHARSHETRRLINRLDKALHHG